ncbi:MAG: FlgD immunoglobulin-like domain containing protein [bacterium]
MRSLVLALTLVTSLGAGYDLLTEDFDSAWSTSAPPAGWRIHYTGAAGNDDWHRRPELLPPWTGHPTPYAAIFYDLAGDELEDSLITPVIDCSGYTNVTLNCSTVFVRNVNQPYTAQLRYSIDGGISYPYLLRDYRELNVGPALETFTLTQASNASQVCIAWIHVGNKAYISHWAIDDVVVTGESIPDWDIECEQIVNPPARLMPGDLTPRARFRNNGLNDQTDIPVECRLYDDALNLIDSWSELIPVLASFETVPVDFDDHTAGLTAGQYLIEFWCEAALDDNPLNDTLNRAFTVSYSDELRHDDGAVAGYESWPVGHYGWGARFEPTSYPVYLESLKAFLQLPANPADNRFQFAVMAEAGSEPGDLLHRSRVLPGADGWNSVPVGDNGDAIVINSGAFYVFCLQVGEPPECPSLGYDAGRNPGATWWQYRAGTFVPDSTDRDFMVRVVINHEALPPLTRDMRTTHIEFPWYEFVQRPYDRPLAVRARVHNNGTDDLADFAVVCSIATESGDLRFFDQQPLALTSGEDAIIEFLPWVPLASEACSVWVTVRSLVAPLIDDQPLNDTKSFGFAVRKGIHTGVSPSGYYAWIDGDTATGPTYDWVSSDSASLIIASGDEQRIYVPIGFEFRYFDTTYTNIYVTTNGWLSFGPDPLTNESLPAVLPDPATPNNALYAWWDNLACGPGFGGGRIWSRTVGTAPNRRLAIIWENVNRVGTDTSDLLSFQVILQENGHVIFQYRDVTTGDLAFNDARGAGIGLENRLGSDGLTYLYARPPMSAATNDLENRVRSGSVIRLNPVLRDAAALEILTPTGYVFPQQYVPQAKIQNYGTVVDDIHVWMKIKPGYVDSTVVSGLLPGDSTTVMFAPWDAQVGTYTAICSTWMSGDIDSTNDIVSTVVVVSPWIQREDIPVGPRRRRVKFAALTHVPTENKLYALKGSNDNEVWAFDIATGEWALVCSMPIEPSGRRAKYGCDLAFDPDHGNLGSLWAIKAGGVTDFYRYDIETKIWIPCSSVTSSTWGARPPKKGAALAYVPGLGSEGAVFCLVGNNTNLVLRFDVASGGWGVLLDVGGRRFEVPFGPRGRRCKFGSDMVFADTTLFTLKGSNTLESYSLNPFSRVVRPLDSAHLYIDRRGRRRRVKEGASMTYLDGALYMLKGGNQQEFWKYRMDQDSWLQITDIPISLTGKRLRVRRGSALAAAESTIYCLKGSGGFEFWEYKPSADTATGALMAARPGRSGVMAGQAGPLGPQLAAAPNPMVGHTVVRCNVVHRDRTSVKIYDAGGRLVRRLVDATLPTGRHSFSWDGLDDSRRAVPRGVYLLRLENGPALLTRKLVLQR